MQLDHPAIFAVKHNARSFGTLHTLAQDAVRSKGPISLHTALVDEFSEVERSELSPGRVPLGPWTGAKRLGPAREPCDDAWPEQAW